MSFCCFWRSVVRVVVCCRISEIVSGIDEDAACSCGMVISLLLSLSVLGSFVAYLDSAIFIGHDPSKIMFSSTLARVLMVIPSFMVLIRSITVFATFSLSLSESLLTSPPRLQIMDAFYPRFASPVLIGALPPTGVLPCLVLILF